MLKSRNQKGLLLLDNCPTHKCFEERYDGVKTNLEVKISYLRYHMLPPNTSSKLQPCDQGVIRSPKAHYGGKLQLAMARLLIHKAAKDVSLYEGLQMVRTAWANNVTDTVFKNTWRKSGIRKEQVREEMDSTEQPLEICDDFEQRTTMEDKEPVAESPPLDIDSVIDGTMEKVCEENLDSEEDESTENSPVPPSVSECLKMMDSISKRFIFSSGGEPVCVTELKQVLMSLPKSQSLITDFLNKK